MLPLGKAAILEFHQPKYGEQHDNHVRTNNDVK